MPKNIVILLDGTSNQVSGKRSNILRLYGTLEKSERQLVYYDPGVGTLGDANAWLRFWRKAVEVWGLATGWGLDENVKEAYRFLVESYDKGSGAERDSIFIFGFSRGAYTARVLAGFINAVGLIEKRNLNLLDYAFRDYKGVGEDEKDPFAKVRFYERTLGPERPPIRALGLFDTVASVIEHGRYLPRLRTHAYTKRNPSVQSVRQALAIDERRVMFRPQLWPAGNDYWGGPFKGKRVEPQDVRELWFAGVHADIGGGYPEEESALAKLPLHWMIEETRPFGLLYRQATVDRIVLGGDEAYAKPDPLGRRHNSMSWAWAILEFLPRFRRWRVSLPLFARRTIPVGARIHASVFARAKATGETPANLPDTYETEPAAGSPD